MVRTLVRSGEAGKRWRMRVTLSHLMRNILKHNLESFEVGVYVSY